MTRVCVEVGFGSTLATAALTGGTWTDITGFADIVNGLVITRGAQDELSQTQPGTLSLILDNSDGRFTPTNVASPYSPNVVKNVPIRVSVATVETNYVRNPSFEGGETGSTSTWTWPAGVDVVIFGTPVQSGTKAARVTWNASASDYFETVVYGLTIGATYTASAYVRVPAGDVAVKLRMGGTDSSASAVNDVYTRLTVTFTATAAVMPLRVIPAATPAAGDLVFVDAVQVEAGAAATTFTATAAQLHWRFWGLVNQWPVKWSGLYSTVSITATDVFKSLSRTEALAPMVVEEMLRWDPHACYPLAEESGATSSGDVSGLITPGALALQQSGVGGTLDFAAGTAPLGVERAPLFTPASATAGKYLRASLGPDFQAASSAQFLLVEAWFATSTQGRNILTLHSADNNTYIIFYLASGTGFLTVESRASDTTTTTTVGATNLANGALHHLVYDEEAKELFIDGVSLGVFPAINTMADITQLTVGASHTGNNLWNGSLSCIGLYADTTMSAANLTDHYTAGTTGHAGETANARGFRLAEYAGIPFATEGTLTGGLAHQAALGNSPLHHLQEVETTESGKLFARRDSPGVVLQSRTVRYNPTSALSLAYADLETADVELADDDQKLINIAVVSRPGGATKRLVHAASVAANGPYERSVEVLRTSDNEATDLGSWLLYRYADPPPELRQVAVEAYSLPVATYRALLDADISTVMTVTGMPSEAPASSMPVTVEGYSETIRHNQHVIAFHTSRTNTDAVWVLDDPVYSVLGTTTRLAY